MTVFETLVCKLVSLLPAEYAVSMRRRNMSSHLQVCGLRVPFGQVGCLCSDNMPCEANRDGSRFTVDPATQSHDECYMKGVVLVCCVSLLAPKPASIHALLYGKVDYTSSVR